MLLFALTKYYGLNIACERLYYCHSAKMLRLHRFRSGFAAELSKDNAINLAAAVFVCCFIAQTFRLCTLLLLYKVR